MASAKEFKIVDNFNGYSDSRRFDTRESAEVALQADIDDFFGCLQNQNSSCRLTVVPADAAWYWDQRQNQWAWNYVYTSLIAANKTPKPK